MGPLKADYTTHWGFVQKKFSTIRGTFHARAPARGSLRSLKLNSRFLRAFDVVPNAILRMDQPTAFQGLWRTGLHNLICTDLNQVWSATLGALHE